MSLQAFTGSSKTITSERSLIEKPSFLGRFLARKKKLDITLEELIDVDRDLEIYTNHQITLLNPQILYKTPAISFNTQLLRINREEEILVTTEPINLRLISKESSRKIRQSGKRLLHLGLIVIGIKGLVRKSLGTKVLIAVLDNGWKTNANNALISAIEVDMNDNKGIFYCSPDFSVSTQDIDLLEIGIQTRGYEDLDKKSNLLINIGFIGRLTDSSTTQYKLNIDGIISGISSKGVQMIKPMEISSEQFNGLDWNINKNLRRKSQLVPQENMMYRTLQGDYNLRFSDYINTNLTIESDSEAIDEQI